MRYTLIIAVKIACYSLKRTQTSMHASFVGIRHGSDKCHKKGIKICHHMQRCITCRWNLDFKGCMHLETLQRIWDGITNIGMRTVFYIIHQMRQYGNISIINTLILLWSLEMWGFAYMLMDLIFTLCPQDLIPFSRWQLNLATFPLKCVWPHHLCSSLCNPWP